MCEFNVFPGNVVWDYLFVCLFACVWNTFGIKCVHECDGKGWSELWDNEPEVKFLSRVH